MGSYEHPTIDGAHKRSRELSLGVLFKGLGVQKDTEMPC